MKSNIADQTMDGGVESLGGWAMVEAQLPEDYRELAVERGILKPSVPKQLGAKVTDISQVLRLAFYHVGTNSSLRMATAAAFAANVIAMSPVALHKWMRKLGPYAADLLALMLNATVRFAAERWAGFVIRVVDATVITNPGACRTTARAHYAITLSNLRPEQIYVTDETGGETFRRFQIKEGDLWMGDRAYANAPGIAHVVSQGGEVLVRHNRGSLPLFGNTGKRIDTLEKLASFKKRGQVREWTVWVRPRGQDPIKGRLCAVWLPKDKAEEARDRLRKEMGNKATAEALKAAEYVTIFTTVSRDRLSKERVMELYGLRWQVELHIKRDKSIAGLDALPNFRPDTIFSWLVIKLLLTQIARQIASPEAFPPRSRSQRQWAE